MDHKLIKVFNSLSFLKHINFEAKVNDYSTDPNEFGLINKDLSNISFGLGHRFQIFRNGHCEFMNCIESHPIDKEGLGLSREMNIEEEKNTLILFYSDVASHFISQIKNLKKIWDSFLPFNDMLLSALIFNTKSTRLYSYETYFGPLYGSKVNLKVLECNFVTNKKSKSLNLTELVLKRISNYFGLVLYGLYDEKNQPVCPQRLKE